MQDFYLICPECKNRLNSLKEGFNCQSCGRDYPITQGVACFKKDRFYWQEGKEKLQKINAASLKQGWRQGLEDNFQEAKPQYLDGILDQSRADFAYILPIASEAIVLDLGAGWGSISIALAKHYRHVYAIDACYEKMQFLQIRKDQESIDNITCMCADGFKLPFPDDFFDAVVLYGVLEWAGYSSLEEPALKAQLRFMQEVCRVLKKGGCAYISIENRWALVYFLGFPDPHTSLPFISIMPRFLADIYSKLVYKRPYSVITHSIKGYKAILKNSGFENSEFFTPLPSYRKFYYLIPLEDKRAVKFFINNLARAQTKLARVLLGASRIFKINQLIKHIASDYAIIARK